MYSAEKILLAKGTEPVYLLPPMANRHGLIAGATGTGKTITLKVMAESFSDMGVPVFLTDIKGDLASLARSGTSNEKLQQRLDHLEIKNFTYQAFPVRFWDLYGEAGHPVRTTVSEMGATLLARLLDLNATQTGVLNIVFRAADERGLLLLDLKDLRAMLQYVGDHAKEFTLEYGHISTASIGAILRSLLALEDQGGNYFFGEPNLDILDWLQIDQDGRGYINVLHCGQLIETPIIYATFLLWLLSELFETLPEVGDPAKPRLVFFFDEAHLLFEDAPKVLIQKIEQVIKLIRSKGVGIYFITQNPADLPEDVLGQLGNRVQHALRAYTPSEQKQIKAAAQAFRSNPTFDTVTAITELGTGEALISCLDENGRPGVVQRAMLLPPQSQFGTLDDITRQELIAESPFAGKYDRLDDRQSAYELIKTQEKAVLEQAEPERLLLERQKQWQYAEAEQHRRTSQNGPRQADRSFGQNALEKAANSAVQSIGRELGRSLVRGLLGSLRK